MKKLILPSFFLLFLSGFLLLVFPPKVFSQDQLKNFYTHEFTLEECQKITASLPQDVFSKLDVNEAMPYLCVVEGSGAKEYEQDVELSILNFTISKPIKSDLQKIYSGDQEFTRPGAIPYKRSEIDVDGGKAIIKTNTFPPNLPDDLYSYYGERAESDVSIFIGDCLFGFAGRSYTNQETYSNYHYPQNAHPDYDHGTSSLHKKMLDLTPKIATAIKLFCGGTEESSSPSKKETAREWFDRTIGPLLQNEDKQKEQFEEPAGKGIGEFIRKIQSLRLNPFDKPQDQIGSTEQKTPGQTVNDWIMENDLISNPAQIEQLERERQELYRKIPQMTEEMIKKAQEEWKLTTELMRTAPKFEYVLEGEWPDVKSVPWDTESGAVIKSDSWQGVYIEELADRVTKTVIFREGEMEVKVINKNPVEDKVKVVVDDFFDIFVIQTHFRVEYDPGKKLGVVNVYEGEVEVRTKEGKTIKVKPDGDRPGVMVVSKKLSPVKLAILGLIMAVVVGGVIWFLKKKIVVKSSKKR